MAKPKLLKFSIPPNTCHDCGAERKNEDGSYIYHTEVYAVNLDVAKSGGGICAICAGVEPEPVVAVLPDAEPVAVVEPEPKKGKG